VGDVRRERIQPPFAVVDDDQLEALAGIVAQRWREVAPQARLRALEIIVRDENDRRRVGLHLFSRSSCGRQYVMTTR
jgi:hypothetical protein